MKKIFCNAYRLIIMLGSPQRLIQSVVGYLSPGKNKEDDALNQILVSNANNLITKCASGVYCPTPNDPVPALHKCKKCKKKCIFGVGEVDWMTIALLLLIFQMNIAFCAVMENYIL